MTDINIQKYLKDLGIENESVRLGVERFLKESIVVEGQLVHKRLNLYLDMGKACTADCEFCIAKIKDKSQRIKNFEQQLEGLKKAVKYCYSVEVLGGEPLLFASEIKQMLPYFGERMTVFVTNATRHLFLKNLDLLDKFDHVDISRHALDDQENTQIFRTRVDLLKRDDFSELPEDLKKKIRFNITCFEGGLDSAQKALDFVKEFSGRGLHQYMFANLTKLPRNVYETEVEKFTDNYRLDDKVFNDLAGIIEDQKYTLIKRIDGLGYRVRIYDNGIDKIILKENDDTNNQILISDMYEKFGLLADLVLTPNGEGYSDWYYSHRVV